MQKTFQLYQNCLKFTITSLENFKMLRMVGYKVHGFGGLYFSDVEEAKRSSGIVASFHSKKKKGVVGETSFLSVVLTSFFWLLYLSHQF